MPPRRPCGSPGPASPEGGGVGPTAEVASGPAQGHPPVRAAGRRSEGRARPGRRRPRVARSASGL